MNDSARSMTIERAAPCRRLAEVLRRGARRWAASGVADAPATRATQTNRVLRKPVRGVESRRGGVVWPMSKRNAPIRCVSARCRPMPLTENIAATTAGRQETRSSCAAIVSTRPAAEWSVSGAGPAPPCGVRRPARRSSKGHAVRLRRAGSVAKVAFPRRNIQPTTTDVRLSASPPRLSAMINGYHTQGV